MTRNTGTWGGRDVDRARALMATQLPIRCCSCPRVIKPGDAWVIHHKQSRGAHPELTWEPSNWAIQCRTCSNKSGQQGVIDKAKADARRADHKEDPLKTRDHKPVSLSETRRGQRRHSPSLSPEQPTTPVFQPESLEGVPWLADLLDPPESFAWPRYMTPPHPDAVGSYGQQVEDWLRESQGIEWRHWLRLATRRQLEHDAAGRLVWRTVVDSTPRRAGKSTRQRGVATWRMEHGRSLFGDEVQTIMHTGSDMAVCREVQRLMWRWAEDVAGWTVIRSNGKEAVERPGGDRWLIRSQTGVYSYQVTMALVDESWDVDALTVDEGLEPSLMDGRVRFSHQLWLASTAHRRATSLMRRRIGAAVSGMGEDWKTLLMLWGCAPDDDVGDPETWRLASPYWDEDRYELVSDRYERAMRGEADPEADDPDPMQGFAAQYCNRWPDPTAKPVTGEPVVDATEWESLNGYRPGTPAVAAVEAWFQAGAAMATAEQLPDGRIGVSAVTFADVPSAVAAAQASGAAQVLVGKSLATGLVGVEAAQGTTRQAVEALRRFIDDGILTHDGSEALAEQVLGLRTVAGSDGPRLASKGRADAVKALAWAVERARHAIEQPMIWV
jgi:hypothetical protein